MLIPPPIAPPARLHVMHAAGRTDPAAVRSGMDLLGQRGFVTTRDPALGRFGDEAHGLGARMRAGQQRATDFLAGPDALRARDVVHALSDTSVAAVVAARGGYGAMRLLDRLPPDLLAANPKWIAGYSDITALHLWAYRQGVATLHAPMVASLARHAEDGSVDALVDALGGRPRPLPVTQTGRESAATGRLLGGNLSLLAALRPTRWWPSLEGALLLVEEVGEPLYRVDRMLQTLLLAGGLERAAGFVLGQFAGCGRDGDGDEAGEGRALELAIERLSELGRPILVGAPCGHGVPNVAFVHGGIYRYDDGALRYERPRQQRARSVRRHPTTAQLLSEAVAAGVASGVQLHVSRGAEVVADLAMGTTAWTDDAVRAPVEPGTLFDVASVTKAIATAVLVHRAVADGVVALDTACPEEICGRPRGGDGASPRAGTPPAVTLRDLLRHTSGLPAYERVWEEARRQPDPAAFARERFAGIAPDWAGTGTEVYSDVGYVALGRWLEQMLGAPIDVLFERYVTAPLGITGECRFGVGAAHLATVAATEVCPSRDATLQGMVHDENCQVLGGAAGHAGVFATARAVGVLGRSLLGHGAPILAPTAVATMWSTTHRIGSYTLGWDTPSGRRSNAGRTFDRATTVGHLGFTGCSIWIDRSREVVAVLNTNRVHPNRDNAGIRWLRPAVHDAVIRELGTTRAR